MGSGVYGIPNSSEIIVFNVIYVQGLTFWECSLIAVTFLYGGDTQFWDYANISFFLKTWSIELFGN